MASSVVNSKTHLIATLSLLGALALSSACSRAPSAQLQNDAAQSAAYLGSQRWLHTQGNQILNSDNQLWMGRGVNIFDTRGCNACAYGPPNVAEVKRRADVAINDWHVNFLRLNLESYAVPDGRVQWQGVTSDPAYLAEVKDIVDHISHYSDTYILLSLLIDPSYNAQSIPNNATAQTWRKLTQTFGHYPNVIFAVANEPHNNSGDAQNLVDNQNQWVWNGMNEVAGAIRATEDAMGVPHHLVSVQGTTWWARFVNYYVTHPIPFDNIVYETHVYDHVPVFDVEVTQPHRTLPMIIGEFGFWPEEMSLDDCRAFLDLAEREKVPYTAWAFSANCGAAPLLTPAGSECVSGTPIIPNAWGTLLRNHLLAVQAAPVTDVPTPEPTPVEPPVPTPTSRPTPVVPLTPTPTEPQDQPTVVPATPLPVVTPTRTPTATPTHTPTVTPTSQGASGSGAIRSASSPGTCFDVVGGAANEGSGAIVMACNGQSTQRWTWSGGTLQVGGKCLRTINNGTHDGAFLEVGSCDPSRTQAWQKDGSAWRLAGTSMCVGTLGGLFYDYISLVINPCTGAAAQKWQ